MLVFPRSIYTYSTYNFIRKAYLNKLNPFLCLPAHAPCELHPVHICSTFPTSPNPLSFSLYIYMRFQVDQLVVCPSKSMQQKINIYREIVRKYISDQVGRVCGLYGGGRDKETV